MDRGENDNDCQYHDGSFALVLMVELWRNFGNIVITRLVWKISRVGRMEKMFDSRER